jgi:predicted N-acetyltransferase YhbS
LKKPFMDLCWLHRSRKQQSRSAMKNISYRKSPVTPEQLADVFRRSTIRRPVDDLSRMKTMLENSNLLLTAWDDDKLVGVARALTDYSYCCYLSDLAVDVAYQRAGIGKTLIGQVREAIGPQSMLLLLAAPEAMDYYSKVGFDAVANGWIIKRTA